MQQKKVTITVTGYYLGNNLYYLGNNLYYLGNKIYILFVLFRK